MQEGERLRDDDLFKYLHELKRSSSSLKRLKCLPGTLKLEVSPCPDDVKYALTPELARLQPYPGPLLRLSTSEVDPSCFVYFQRSITLFQMTRCDLPRNWSSSRRVRFIHRSTRTAIFSTFTQKISISPIDPVSCFL